MATHSSTPAWQIPWTEEPGRLQSLGSPGVGHDWATSLSLFTFHTLEKEMATHSSVLAWRIPRTGEPGGLPSLGLHRVRHDWSNLVAAAVVVKNLPASAGDTRDTGLIPGLWRSPRIWNGNLIQYSCLESFMDRGVWQDAVHGLSKNWAQLST